MNIYNSWKNRETYKRELTREELIEQQRPAQEFFRELFKAQNKNK